MTVHCVLFEDSHIDRLRPMNWARPTFAITCGGMSLGRLVTTRGWKVIPHVQNHLRGIVARDRGEEIQAVDGALLYLNAALVPDLSVMARIVQLVEAGQPFLALNDQRVTAAWSPDGFPERLVSRPSSEVVNFLLEQRLDPIEDEFPLFDHTFDVIREHQRLLPEHLRWRIEHQKLKPYAQDVYMGEDCQVGQYVVFDTSKGPICIDDNVSIGPFSYIAGPVSIGKNCRIIDHASIKHGTYLGHTVKAGGEIEESVVEPFSNKQHHGFLGHAYVGSWVNLGAGTSNSDLKNTYGPITIDEGNQSVNSNMQFLGCVIGDYTKSAINTSILTGKLVGVGSYLYGYVSTNVASFTNYARTFGQITEVSVDVTIKTQTRAAKRRQVTMTPEDILLLQQLFEITRYERQLSSEQVVL